MSSSESTMENLEEIFDYVIGLTKACGVIFAKGFYGKKDVVEKDGHYWDLVTEFDGKIEDMLMRGISDKYPNHKFIAEETAAREKNTPDLTDAPTWIIDPIDGTCNYIHGLPLTAISIGMTWRKEIVIGIIYNPITKELFSARKGNGAHLNGTQIHTSRIKKLQNSTIAHELSLAGVASLREKNIKRLEAVVAKVQGIRSFGCAAMSLAYVAQGVIDGYHIDDMKPWDMAAGVILITEAGGVVYAPDGGAFNVMRPDIVAACTEELARELLPLMKY